MSRRKQSKPRQIKRSIGDLEEGEDNLSDAHSLSEEGGEASDQEDSAECDGSSPASAPVTSEEPTANKSPGTHEGKEDQGPAERLKEEEEEEQKEDRNHWNGPEELELFGSDGDSTVRAKQGLLHETTWGPFRGKIQVEAPAVELAGGKPKITLVTDDRDCWITRLSLTSDGTAANVIIYNKGDELYCKTSQVIPQGESVMAVLVSGEREGSSSLKIESTYPAALHSEIQLLPQQAGMAAILATAVVNKDIFPCKDCGIWYRSTRNLQAHLMYYCASRQKQDSSPPPEKPKDSYPNERICPFPHCSKSCPSTSSLEIHMRTHSGERPFVCLICLSAFTTKANCERHLKVHTDTLNGICHGCGFVSTTRDILYSHLVTNHMLCQPGSKSEVYTPGPGLPVLPLTAGLNLVDPASSVKCSLCGFLADSSASLQQHALAHAERRAQGDSSRDQLQKSPKPSEHLEQEQDKGTTPSALHYNSTSPKANGNSPTPSQCNSPEAITAVRIKEEPKSAQNSESESETDDSMEQKGQANPASDRSSGTTPPRNLHSVKVKTEHSSPTPGSSPVNFGTGSLQPGGTVFLPQYMFNPEASVVPQASEILAKMSEMVHSRLKQGQGGVPPFYAGSPIQKGATCFECDINFNNINNYYVHKRLYCSGRHQQGDNSVNVLHVKDSSAATVTATTTHSSPSAAGSQIVSAPQSDTEPEQSTGSNDAKMIEVKREEVCLKDISSEGESGSRVSEGSQSPCNSVEEAEDDPTKTFCEACNIRFSRHDNYMVHKRYYCASRHDPPHQRTRSGKVTFLPQPVRTRKRRKLYEIHMAQNEAVTNQTAPVSIKQEPIAMVGRPLEPPSVPISLVSTTGSNAVPSPSSSPDGEGPIDLSKKPRLQDDQLVAPLLPLADYHKCTACSISFNSVENYLAHKKYYCPATQLQQKAHDQLQKMKRAVSSSPKSKVLENADLHEEHLDLKVIKTENNASGVLVPTTACTNTTSLPGGCSLSSEVNLHQSPNMKALPVPLNVSQVVCPYCPLNGAIKGDLLEHFKNVHGLLLTMQAFGHAAQSNNMKDILQPSRSQASTCASPTLSPRVTPKSPPKLRSKSTLNCREENNTASPLLNGSTGGINVSPLLVFPVSPATRVNISSVPEALREAGLKPLTPSLHADKRISSPKAIVPPVQNGNHRYCRLCNIKFSSLSTFIAHKKYYCSSHSAEHVK
ncbi:zinc finger protein ZFPM1-like isoform X2 [Polyodon spathula]|uniref:zinc finger protein ZFPM1-like isoform X2 n=1 Tax=Polyodon spathula TaxID=7913 RepID=UPI001B7F0763|nr:zinc finger protein ZFPM1-like isoform X2 [Polyodon spathula]